jgi:hypothetical protein
MKAEEFEKIWLDQVQTEKGMLLERAEAYATNGDRLGNFYEGSTLAGNTPMQYGFGLVVKHIIAVRDLINKEARGECKLDEKELEKFTEYVTDIRNYAVLLKSLYMERSNKVKGSLTVATK